MKSDQESHVQVSVAICFCHHSRDDIAGKSAAELSFLSDEMISPEKHHPFQNLSIP
jgi:hypothetical protein